MFHFGFSYIGLIWFLMVLYELYWIRYFKSERTMKDYYSSFLGVPVARATLPVQRLMQGNIMKI